jgi:hypothetical protein
MSITASIVLCLFCSEVYDFCVTKKFWIWHSISAIFGDCEKGDGVRFELSA